MKNSVNDTADESLLVVDAPDMDETNVGCQVRRKIEDYLDERRYRDEMGDDLDV